MFIKDCSRQYANKYSECKLLTESYRDENGIPRHRTILNLSRLPSELAGVIEDSVNGKRLVSLEDIKETDNRSLGEVTTLKRLADRLGITKILRQHLGDHLAALVLVMVINRISLPKSRYSLRDWLETTYLPEILKVPLSDFHHNHLYEALTFLADNQTAIEDDLWKITKNRKQAKRQEEELTLMLYDITSTYLEGEQNELAEYGYSRDKKRGKKQLIIGLVTTKTGTPVTVEALPGSTQDRTTLLAKIRELKRRLAIKEVVYVFDRGMRDQPKLAALRSYDIRYITALRRDEIRRLLEERSAIQLGMFDEYGLAEYEFDARRYIICRSDQERRNQERREILLGRTAEKLEMIKRNVAQGRVKDQVKVAAWAEAWLLRWKMKKYFRIKVGKGYFSYQKREDLVKEAEVLDGIYILETNTGREVLSAKEIKAGYKNLSKVEQNFRTIKSVLEVRPVHHRRAETTKGHIFICFLALYLKKELGNLLRPLLKEHTFSYLLTQLREIRQSKLETGRYQATILNELNGTQKAILNTLHLRITPIPIDRYPNNLL